MKPIALLFPGGGTQYVGMGKSLYENFAVAREVMDLANDLLDYDLKGICFEGSFEQLSRMENSQPAIFTVSVAAYKVFEQETRLVPAFGVGHSLGEYAALTCAGALRFEDAIRLVRKRGELLQETGTKNNGTMMAVNKMAASIIEEECRKIREKGGSIYVAVYNSDLQSVVAGDKRSIGELGETLKQRGADMNVLTINTPSHCPLMQEASSRFEMELSKYTVGRFKWPVIANVSGVPYDNSDELRRMLAEHMVKPVRWQESIRYATSRQVGTFIDLGPQVVLKNMMRFIQPDATAYAFDLPEDAENIRQLLKGEMRKYTDILKKCLTIAVSTKNYNDDPEEYATEVVASYRRLKHIQEELSLSTANDEHLEESVTLLERILAYKKLPLAEKNQWMAELTDCPERC